MSIQTQPLARRFRYNGMTLADVPGMSNEQVRDLYSAQYPELISAEIELGEVARGAQDINFKRAVGTKG